MVKDRLQEMLEKSKAIEEYKFVHEHEFRTRYNQELILEDLDQFSEISGWIRQLHRNVTDIEVNIFCEGWTKASQRLRENANLCYRIYGAVKRLPGELDNKKKAVSRKDCGAEEEDFDGDNLVNRIRSVQFESIKTAYTKAYWKYDAVVRRYEDKVKRSSIVIPIADDFGSPDATDPLLTAIQYRRLSHCDQILLSKPIEEVYNTLNAVEERHQELMVLERSLIEMRDLFVLFSTLVMEHGSILNLVEGNVQAASQHVARAVVQLQAARGYQWQATKRKCLCFSATSVLVVILVILVAVAVLMAVKKLMF
ncbi:syntaxin-1B-like isoform X1 [Armigeres subalbatus]|uniref:syntaxin-1B-like isoform X1 n=1 Tax=Armigeres subalbatus TaxID=124917 RepID=UPI002ED1F728